MNEQKAIKRQLHKIIDKDQITEVMYEARYNAETGTHNGEIKKTLIGSTITIKTLEFPYKSE